MALTPGQQAALERSRIYPVLVELSACLCTALGEDAPCFCGILMGDDLPVEYVDCEIGSAFVRVITAFPSSNFPEPDVLLNSNSIRAYTLGVGIMRPAPFGQGVEPATAEDVAEHSLLLLSDQQVTWEAIACCFSSKYDDELDVSGPLWTPFPNEGGIDGGEWLVTVREPF